MLLVYVKRMSQLSEDTMATHEVSDEELPRYIDLVTTKFFPRSIVVRFTFYCRARYITLDTTSHLYVYIYR